MLTLLYLLCQFLTRPDAFVSVAGQLTLSLQVSAATALSQLLQSSTPLADVLLQLLTQTQWRKVIVEEVQEDEEQEEQEVFFDSDLTGCNASPELRPAAGGHG